MASLLAVEEAEALEPVAELEPVEAAVALLLDDAEVEEAEEAAAAEVSAIASAVALRLPHFSLLVQVD